VIIHPSLFAIGTSSTSFVIAQIRSRKRPNKLVPVESCFEDHLCAILCIGCTSLFDPLFLVISITLCSSAVDIHHKYSDFAGEILTANHLYCCSVFTAYNFSSLLIGLYRLQIIFLLSVDPPEKSSLLLSLCCCDSAARKSFCKQLFFDR